MSKYTLIIKKDARKYRTPLFETNNNTIGLEMQQKEVKICGGVGRGSGGCLLHRKKFATRGRFRYDKRCKPFSVQQPVSPENPHPRRKFFRGVTGDRFKFIASF